jgi:hypothetical protein
MRRWVTAAAVLAALAVTTSGCASAGASGPGAPDGAATVVPAGATAFVAASTDLSSSQWHGLGTFALKQLEQQTKVDWSNDVQPLVGGEVDVALLPGKQAVAFVQPRDAVKLAAFVKKHSLATRVVGHWTAVARSAAVLDAVANAHSHLSDLSAFGDAMKALPSGALVRAYASGAHTQALLQSVPLQLQTTLLPPGVRFKQTSKPSALQKRFSLGLATQSFPWLAAALIGTDHGLKLQAVAPDGPLTSVLAPRYALARPAPYTSALVEEIPAGVLAVLDFKVPQASGLSALPPALLTKLLGKNASDLVDQLDQVVGGETAIYVRPALPIPEVTIVTQPNDTTAASAALDQLLQVLPKTGPFAGVTLHRAVIGGQYVVSTTQKGIDDFRSGGAKLSADPAFLAAAKDAGMPNQTTGFAYADVKAALPLLALAGAKLPAGLPQLGGFLAYAADSGKQSTFSAFLGVG